MTFLQVTLERVWKRVLQWGLPRAMALLLCLAWAVPAVVAAQDSIYMSLGLPGRLASDGDVSGAALGPLKNGQTAWKVSAEDPTDVQVAEDPRVSLNLEPRQLALTSRGASRLTLPFDKEVSSGRVRVSLNLSFLKDHEPPSFSIYLVDAQGRKGPSVIFDFRFWKTLAKAMAVAQNCTPIQITPFISKKSAAYPPYSKAFLSTIRIVFDFDQRTFILERNLEYANDDYQPDRALLYHFDSEAGPFTAIEIDVPSDPASTGAVYLGAVSVEDSLVSSSELDRIISDKRKVMDRASNQYKFFGEMPQDPDAFRKEVIWQTNPVIHTPNGKFIEYYPLIPRLKDLGVTMVYFVPVWKSNTSAVGGLIGFPIHDGFSVNPAFGHDNYLRDLVAELHRNNIKVIADFAFHSVAWSSPIVREHPEWLVKEAGGGFFNGYTKPLERMRWIYMYRLDLGLEEVQKGISSMMSHWVGDYGLDGFRLDMAYTMFDSTTLPMGYRIRWPEFKADNVIRRLREDVDKVRPGVLFLTESANPGLLRNGSDLDYSGFWRLRRKLKDCSNEKMAFRDIVNVVSSEIPGEFPETKLFLWGLETHDFEPSVNHGTAEREGFGVEKTKIYMSLISTIPGAIVIFGGQEEGDRFYYQEGYGASLGNIYGVRQKPVAGMYDFYKRIFKMRNDFRLYEGSLSDVVDLKPDSPDVAAYIRVTSSGVYIIVINHSSGNKQVRLQVPSKYSGLKPAWSVDLESGNEQNINSIESIAVTQWSARLIVLQ